MLAKADPARLASLWADVVADLGGAPPHEVLRPAETGLVMVRGRMGGNGDAFNVGEMTATRTVIRLESGEVGVGYVSGRDRTHATTAALADAMLQTSTRAERVKRLIDSLADEQAAARDLAARKAAATRVDFFTMVRTRGPG